MGFFDKFAPQKPVPDYGVLTPKRKVIYQNFMVTKGKPDDIRTAADAFDKAGLPVQADMLRKRAALIEVPKDLAKARAEVYKTAMQSKDPQAVRGIADAYEKIAATMSAQRLRDYAKSLETSAQAQAISEGTKS